MHEQPDPHAAARGTFLSIFLAVIGGVVCLMIFLLLISPFLVQALGGVVVLAVVAMIGCLHYWLWGRSMDQEVAGEREERQARSDADWPYDRPTDFRRF
ncbi:MAG: hypothetical protein ACK4RK_06755 [Gemmataceae bacterium]